MKRSELKRALFNATGCRIQHTGWCCGTCFFNLSKKLTNKDWQAVLFFRDKTATNDMFDNLPKNIEKTIEKVYKIAVSRYEKTLLSNK